MKRITKAFLAIIFGFIFLFGTTAFIIGDPSPNFLKEDLTQFKQVSLNDLHTNNSKIGNFKTSVNFRKSNSNTTHKEFYGQEIRIEGNPNIDRILIGVTNNLISRIEVWNANKLVETKELGFMDKMTWGEYQKMTVEFNDQVNSRHEGKCTILMRFYEGTGILGDIGTISLDMTKYGVLSGNKKLKLFSKSLESEITTIAEFSNLKIWKNYKSFD